MEVGRCVEVFNPYDWLPGHGGEFCRTWYASKESVTDHCVRRPGWRTQEGTPVQGVCAFYKTAFPGPNLLDLHCSVSSPVSTGALVECPDSEAASAWTRHWNDGRVVKHYSIAFMAENLQFLVFASDVVVNDAVTMPT